MNKNELKHFYFSILMASYCNERYVEVAIKSVLSQTYPYWELIIVDDCSTDHSNEIIKKYLNDNRIKLIHHNYNQGYGSVLRTAAENASYEILAILDSDDKLHEKALETMNQAYNENPQCGYIYSTFWKCDSNLGNCKIDKSIKQRQIHDKFINTPKISHFKTFKKEAYDKTSGFEINRKRAVDKDIIYKLEEVTELKFVNIPLYYYRGHESGISQGKNIYRGIIANYTARCKTYQRRLNKNIPNLNKRDLYIEYYYITFYKLLKFIVILFIYSRISLLIKKLYKKFPNIPIKLKFLKFKNKYVDLF